MTGLSSGLFGCFVLLQAFLVSQMLARENWPQEDNINNAIFC